MRLLVRILAVLACGGAPGMVWAQEGAPGTDVFQLVEGGFRKSITAQLTIERYGIDGVGRASADLGTLVWRASGRQLRKIVVSTSASRPVYELTVEPRNVERATGMGPIRLVDGMLPQDFIRNVTPGRRGRATLYYTATATFEQGAGETNHIVLYTLTSQ